MGKFAWGVKAKHCWALSTNFWKQKTSSSNFPANNLKLHWRWRWWDQIQTIFLNLSYFNKWKFWARTVVYWTLAKNVIFFRKMSATFQRTALLYLFQLKTFVCIESYLSDLQEGPRGSRSSVNNPRINSIYLNIF